MEEVKVTGKCDSGCGKDAVYWYGNTAAATCGSAECVQIMDDSYEEHCKQMEWEWELERQMKEEHGEY